MGFHDMPNRQSKVPSMGGRGQHQHHVTESAQDDGTAGVNTGGIYDYPIGKTQRLDDCVIQGQDGGSHQASVPSGGSLNKGAPEFEGRKDVGGSLRAGTSYPI